MKQIFTLGSIFCVSGLAGLGYAQARTSRYTDIAADKCVTVVFEEEGGYSKQRCKSEGGYEFFVHEGDIRQWVSIKTKGQETPVYLQALHGGAFSWLPARMAEWRGSYSENVFVPSHLIIRTRSEVENYPDKPFLSEFLAVIRLGKKSCLIGFVDTINVSQSNAKARNIADADSGKAQCLEGYGD